MKWTSKSLGSRLQHEFFYVLIRLKLVWLARVFVFFVVFYYTLLPSVRKKSSYYLKRRFPNSNAFEMYIHCFKLCFNFASILLDRGIYAIQGSCELSFIAEARQILMDVIEKDEGSILISAHIGAWQLGLLDMEHINRPISLVQFRDPGDNAKHYFEHSSQKGKHPIKVITSLNGVQTAFEITAAIQNNELVCIMADRIADDSEKMMEVSFLNGKIALPITPYIIASITQCPLLISFTIRENNKVKGVWAECLHIPSGIRRQPELLRPYVERFVVGMESMVEKYPYQFYNFYNMWLENDDK